jgi:Na+/proline symporter
MITGIAILGLVYFSPQVNEMLAAGERFDFEKILPLVIRDFVPVGLVGVLLAGLLAAFMSTFDSTVNAGAAYIVNDIYKRYINPDAPAKRYVNFGYLASTFLVVVAIVVGVFKIESIHEITTWITFGLYGGYVAPNILKWHWWRFNGYGYFAGMIGGIIASLLPLLIWPEMNKMYVLPFSLAVSTLCSVIMCLRTRPESDEVLEGFYRTVRPWGYWRPVFNKLAEKNPKIRENTNLARDAFNVGIGIIWQLMLMVVPICIVIREKRTLYLSLAVLAVTSLIMKFTWYDKLGPDEMYMDQNQ